MFTSIGCSEKDYISDNLEKEWINECYKSNSKLFVDVFQEKISAFVNNVFSDVRKVAEKGHFHTIIKRVIMAKSHSLRLLLSKKFRDLGLNVTYSNGTHIYKYKFEDNGFRIWYKEIETKSGNMVRFGINDVDFSNISSKVEAKWKNKVIIKPVFLADDLCKHSWKGHITVVWLPKNPWIYNNKLPILNINEHFLTERVRARNGKGKGIVQFIFKSQDKNDMPTIVCGHEEKLSAHSEVFDRMFNSGFTESSNKEVLITDIAPEIFELIIDYIYLGTIPNAEALSIDTCVYLLKAAHKYRLCGLVKLSMSLLADFDAGNKAFELDLNPDQVYTDNDFNEYFPQFFRLAGDFKIDNLGKICLSIANTNPTLRDLLIQNITPNNARFFISIAQNNEFDDLETAIMEKILIVFENGPPPKRHKSNNSSSNHD